MVTSRRIALIVQSVFFYDETTPDWAPPDPGHFRAEGMVFAGPEADGPADGFDVEVCTPSWLAEYFDEPRRSSTGSEAASGPSPTPPRVKQVGKWWFADHRVLFGRGLILVRRWDRDVVECAIREAFGTVTAPAWQFAADRAGRFLPWEFEDRHDGQIDQLYRS